MFIQEIIVGILVVGSVIYTAYNTFKLFNIKKGDSACGCTSCDFKSKIDEIKSLTSKQSL